MFAGLMPSEIDKLFPEIWLNDDEEGGKKHVRRRAFEASAYPIGKKPRRCFILKFYTTKKENIWLNRFPTF